MFKKTLLAGLLLVLSSIWIYTYAVRMYINTWALGWTQLKMLCPYQIPVSLYHNPSSGEQSDGATVVVAINTWQINIWYISNQNYNYFQTYVGNSPTPYSGFIFSGAMGVWLYNSINANSNQFLSSPTRFKAGANNTAWFKFSWDKIIGTLGIATYSVSTVSATISIRTWTDSSAVSLWATPLLTSVWWATFTFVTWMCQTDITSPYAQTFDPNIILWWTRVSASSWLSFYVKDDINDYAWSQPGFVIDTWILNDTNYKTWAAGRNLWIDTGTLSFTLRWSGWNYNWWTPLTFTVWNITLLSWMTKTRDRFWRDYYVMITGSSLVAYGKEQGMIFSWSFSDRAGNVWTPFVYSFNNPVKPWLSNQSPANWATNVFPKTDIQVRVSDDWAGVNSGSLSVTIKSGWCAWTPIPWYTFTWARLHLNGVAGIADYPDYRINISSWDVTNLPIPFVSICVEVSWTDLAWNSLAPNNTRTFVTRWFCSDLYWCMDPLDIYFPWNSLHTSYTWTILYITWANSPYPNVTYNNGNYLSGIANCWPTFSFTGFLLTWNIMTGGRYNGYGWNARLNISWWTAQLSGTTIIITPL